MDATEQTPLLQGSTSGSPLASRWKRTLSKDALALKATAKLKRLSQKKNQKLQGMSTWPWYSFLNSMLRPHSHRWQAKAFRSIITFLILLGMLAFILESDQDISHKYHHMFVMLESVSSVVFILEYGLRLYFAPERLRFKGLDPWEARGKFIFSFDSVIDLLSFLPWLLEMVFRLDLPNFSVLRVVRLFRLLKAAPVVGSFDVVARVLYYNAEILCVALLICAVMILTMATLLYYMRPEENNKDFSSILATVYIAVMMLTGQGGPEGDLPWYTKVVVVMTAIFAVAQFAIPASMLTWGFEQEAQRRIVKRAEEHKKQAAKLLSGEMDRVSSSSSDGGHERWREWDEYEEVVVGSDSEADGEEEAGQPVKTFEGLTLKEQARAAKLFGLLDDDDDDQVATADIIGDDRRSDMVADSQLDPDGDGITTIEDFMAWLAHIKSKFPSSVFFELLKGLELRVKHPPRRETPTRRLAAPRTPLAAAGEQRPSFGGILTSQQIRAFAEQYEALEKEVSRLQARNQALEEELARVKSDVQP